MFVALALPGRVEERLGEAQSLLKRELSDADIRWQRLEQSHLTLRFLGEVEARALPACRLAVSEAARRSRPFTLSTAGFGAFPTPARPSVLWLGVGGDREELDHLQSLVTAGLEHVADASRTETFRPHLTLGRVKRMGQAARSAFADLLNAPPPAPVSWRVESVALLSSELRASGARYEELLSARLAAS
ncbi:MAG TPA: RNA 2',3'-cyclic phosphodiesterase [Trueperaceae bacterium]